MKEQQLTTDSKAQRFTK